VVPPAVDGTAAVVGAAVLEVAPPGAPLELLLPPPPQADATADVASTMTPTRNQRTGGG
jgi:hypothetical protein